MAVIKLVQRAYKNKNNTQVINIRLIEKGKPSYFSTGIAVRKDQWNGEVINHANKLSLNALLRKKLVDFEKRYLDAEITGVHFRKKGKQDFHAYWKKKDNSKYKSSYLKKLQDFKPVLYFSDLTPDLLKDYENYCRSKGNKENTVWNAIKFIKSTVNAALKDGTIKVNPIAGYTSIKYVNPKIYFLTEDEINELEKFSLDESNHKTLRDVANWFLFACYSFLRYSDCVRFEKSEHIKDGKIILRTKKTGSDVSIKIHPRLQKVLDRLPGKIFTNYRVNHYLKLISKELEMKPLNFHLARHSGSVMFLNKGGSMETLSKILGHSSLSVTAIYGRVTNQRVDDEITKAFG